jgi:flagellar basal-body rod modification protein FlgD
MATTSITSSMDTSSLQGLSVNPKSVLDKDDFLHLLITQLQYQDPTEPMDTEKILQQTSQLASLETQQNTNKALEQLTESFKQSKNFAAVSAIGKYAKLDTTVKLTKNSDGSMKQVNFNLDFKEDVKSGNIQIFDEKNRLVKTLKIDEQSKGKHSFSWDGLTDAGEKAKTGDYKIVANYVNPDGVTLQADFGSYKIESVKFEDAKTYVKLNGAFIDFTKVDEIYEG